MTSGLSSFDVIDGGAGNDSLYLTDTAGGSCYLQRQAISNVETLVIDTITSGDDIFDLSKFTGLNTVKITDATNSAGFGTTVDKINGQTIQIVTENNSGTSTNFTGTSMVFKGVTDATTGAVTTTNINVEVKNKVTSGLNDGIALASTPTIQTNVAQLTINNANMKDATFFADNSFKVDGLASATKVTSLVLTGSGLSAANTNAITTVANGSGGNVEVATINASALAGDLVISGLTTKADATTVTLGSGDNKVTIAAADAARDQIDIDGGAGNDTLVFTAADLATSAAGTVRPGTTNLETIDVTGANGSTGVGTTTLDLTDTSGVTTVKYTMDGDDHFTIAGQTAALKVKLVDESTDAAANNITVNDVLTLTVVNAGAVGKSDGTTKGTLSADKATTVTIKQGASANTAFSTATLSKATSLTLGGSDAGTDGAKYEGNIALTSLVAAELTGMTINSDEGTITVTDLTSAKLATLTLTGDNNVTFGGSNSSTAKLATIDAGALTGAFTMGASVDVATTATVTTGTGNDTVAFDLSPTANPSMTLTMGEKTGDNDTLTIVGASSGVSKIELAKADQIVQMTGFADAAVQTGIESVDASAITGSGTFTIIGNDEANTIKGGANDDYLAGGAGDDSITGGTGNDTFTMAGNLAGTDTIDGGAGTNDILTFTDGDSATTDLTM